MLNSLGVVLVIAALFYMIAWLLKNDGAGHINDQKGLFAMRRVTTDDDKKPLKAEGAEKESLRIKPRERFRSGSSLR